MLPNVVDNVWNFVKVGAEIVSPKGFSNEVMVQEYIFLQEF